MKTLMISVSTAISLLLCGCGNSWELACKNKQSDWNELKRKITVYDSRTGKVLFEHSGFVYIGDKSAPGNISLIYKNQAGKIKKNDYIGENLSIVAEEL